MHSSIQSSLEVRMSIMVLSSEYLNIRKHSFTIFNIRKGIVLKFHTQQLATMVYNTCKFEGDPFIMKGTLLDLHRTLSALSLSSFIQDIYLKLHTQHSASIAYNTGMFDLDRSVMKCTLLGDQSTLSAMSLLSIQKIFLKLHV